jgi:DNA-binding response OmpR family regulator
MRIAVVEDQLVLADLLKYILETRGHKVDVHATRWQAIQDAPIFKPEIIISDYVIPNDMELPKFVESLKEVPSVKCVMVISGYKEGELAAAQHHLQFLAKPFAIHDVLEKIDACARVISSQRTLA